MLGAAEFIKVLNIIIKIILIEHCRFQQLFVCVMVQL